MAWYESGNWDGLDIQHIKGIMSACIRALNERLELVNEAAQVFYYGGESSQKEYPTAAEFDGMEIYWQGDETPTVHGEKMKWNMEKLVEKLEELVEKDDGGLKYWATDDTCETAWTWEDILDDVGLGEFSATTPWGADPNFWLRLKGIFDRLIYVRLTWGITHDPDTLEATESFFGGSVWPTHEEFLQAKWDGRGDFEQDFGFTPPTSVAASIGMDYDDAGAEHRHGAEVFYQAGEVTPTFIISGVILGSKIFYADSAFALFDDVEGTFFGEAHTVDAHTDTLDARVRTFSIEDIVSSLSDTFTVEATITAPSTHPFTHAEYPDQQDPINGGLAHASIAGDHVEVDVDVSGELTDQS